MSEANEPEYLDSSDTVLPEAEAGRVIGNYRILQRVGEGGMGEVFEAEQLKPVQRRVALKVVKHGMDTRQVVARFESERQALALMNHPSIARVYDAGATERGRPFFVMEFVQGEPITRYCDRFKLRTRPRLELFIQVCDGVQHAHQKGIIHRDLKPSNVLVQIEGDAPVPKIIDFGVAKATQRRLSGETAHTELGQIIGTPEYMSPEQAELTLQDIDTRSDVYSLGVLLYELLVGALPFDIKELRRLGFDEFRRRVREDEPPRPSTKVTLSRQEAAGAAKLRGTDPGALAKRLRGDLDWITMKALEKDRTRRYGSPAELAEDIRRHLRNEPVQARPPSAGYRMGKFVRRHRVGVAAGAVVGALLVAFAAVTFLQNRRLARQIERTNQEAEATNQVTAVLTGLFDLSDPGSARGGEIPTRALLDIGLAKVRASLSAQPRALSRSLRVLGGNYKRLGMYDRSAPLLEEALGLARATFGEREPDTLETMAELGDVYAAQGRNAEADALYRHSLEGLTASRGADDPDALGVRNALAGLVGRQGKFDEAAEHFTEVLAARRRVLGEEHVDTAETLNDLAELHWVQGRYERAEPLLREALRVRQHALGAEHPDTLISQINLALLYDETGRKDQAEAIYLEVIETQRRVLPPGHSDTLTALNNLAGLYFAQERDDEAEPLYREALESQRRELGEDHLLTIATMGNLGELYTRDGRLDEARPLLVAAVDSCRALPCADLHLGAMLRKYGGYLSQAGKLAEAERTLLEAHAILDGSVGGDHDQTKKVARGLADLYARSDRTDEAERWRARAEAP
jgi:non-specific serine/threonine protein kinase/serine/threonine-protein kinase